jgi:hypothetical protein
MLENVNEWHKFNDATLLLVLLILNEVNLEINISKIQIMLRYMICNNVFKYPVALLYLLYTYISVLNGTYYLVTLLLHYVFRLHTTIIL